MSVRVWGGIVVACGALASAACEGSNLFGSTALTPNNGASGTGTVQGSVIAGGAGLGAVPVVLVGQDSTQTGTAGVFVFDSLPPATYQVAVRVPIGYSLAAGQTGTQSVTVTNGGISGVTFILQQTTTTTP